MKRIVLLCLLGLCLPLAAQEGWEKTWNQLQENASYKSAYATAEKAMKNAKSSRQRLLAAYRMSLSAANYQEDAYDSAEARYRSLLPSLEGVERALCYAFLRDYDSALMDTALLQRTPVEQVKEFCYKPGKTQNMTPTVYDMLVVMMQDGGGITPKERVEWQRRLCAFHAGDNDDIRIWHDLRLLQRMSEVPNRHVELEDIQRYIDKYRGTDSPLVTDFYHRAAQSCISREDYVQAVRYCDSAIALFPKSKGGVECAWIRADQLAKRIRLEGYSLLAMPGVELLQKVVYRNLTKLWFRVVPYIEDFRWDKSVKEQMLKTKSVEEWTLELLCNDSLRYEEAYFAIPALKAGHYLLMVSPSADFRKEGFMAYEFHCTDMVHVDLGNGNHLLVDRRNGKPIEGQEVRLERTPGYKATRKVLSTTRTDAEGRFRFDYSDVNQWRDYIVIERDGYRLVERYDRNAVHEDIDSNLQCQLQVDRPIYRPGDTVHAAALAYHVVGCNGMVAPGCRLRLVLKDPNGKQVAEDSVLTDDYGMASTTFVLPVDRIAGQYILWVYNGDRQVAIEWLRVEEYKQPRFMVSVGPAEGQAAPAFGKECTVQGMATAYSGVPIGGARVQYKVSRSLMSYWGWRNWRYEYDTQVAEGEVTAAADGSFTVRFVPEPDSNVELSSSTAFRYTVHVDVTDLNGESHEASTTLRVGFCNTFLGLEQSAQEYRELPKLDLHLRDINDRPLQGSIQVKVERLRRPALPLLKHSVMASWKVHHTMSKEEWRQRFPLFAYDSNDISPNAWPVAQTVVSGEWKVENGDLKVELPQLISGYYRITAIAQGAAPVMRTLCLTRKDASRVQSNNLLWYALDKTSAEVGERVALQFGSAFAGTQVYYMLRVGKEDRVFRRVDCRDDAIHTEYIDVDSSMLGGFQVELFTIREGLKEQWSQTVDVPFSHKKLKVEISTFRDKLLPGETEEWTIRVESGERREKSGLVMTMYDDALNSYGGSDWGFWPWLRHTSARMEYNSIMAGYRADWMVNAKQPSFNGTYPTVWSLVDALPHYNRWRGGRIMYKNAAAPSNVEEIAIYTVVEDVDIEEESAMAPRESKLQDNARGDVVQTAELEEVVFHTADEASVATVGGVGQPEVQVRQNLNSLAFFAADVRTDNDGTATYRFTVPELLTRWNVKGLAVSRDLKIGTLDKTLVTSKPLMVQPNMPRFLRHGDSLSLMAKVVKSDADTHTDSTNVVVTLLLTDAATGDTLCLHTENTKVKDAAQVMFPVEVPQNVYVVTYRIIAVADGMSDGEQGQVPVVSSRQAVTVSQAMYINGVGEKTYRFPLSTLRTPTRVPQLVVAEVVSNPAWLAVKSMPYLKTMENPSTLYLANQLYVNGLGSRIMDELDILNNLDFIKGLDSSQSRLSMNEDVKQTALQATPWLRDAESEEEQMRAVKNYFDTAAMRAQHDKLLKDLAERQNADGGWSWMPEGRSSTWTTQQVLQKVKGEELDTKKALRYVDNEQQRYYERYIKPYAKKYKWQPTDIDYLYMRSLYGKASTEAYKFYYDNALKNYKQYNNLYTQAQLALIFHRHGDRKAALDLLRRLKEKSLESDEMGLYWRDNLSGWYWYSRPIETQALLIQAFAEITPKDTAAIGLMQQWLLKQKQTTHWGNERATTEAIRALMVGETNRAALSNQTRAVEMMVFGEPMNTAAQGPEGYRAQRWKDGALETLVDGGSPDVAMKKSTPGIAWGAVYYQFTDDLDQIPASEMGISIKRTYLHDGPLHVGDRIKVRIEISADRNMDYLELIDGRPSCTEPLTTRAGWRWSDGLSYYMVYNNTDTRCYIEHLDKGRYAFEYEVYVTNPGTFLAGPATMQCMYAPEFRAIAPATRLTVE